MISELREQAGGSAPKPTPDEQTQQVLRVCESAAFINSEVLRHLLKHLSQASLEHPGRPVKEYEIGLAVLGRKENFDPRVDSSVRVHFARLRTKLTEYYLGPGAADRIELSIPKGAYHLLSSYRTTPAQTEPLAVVSSANRPARTRTVLLLGSWTIALLSMASAIWFWQLLPPAVSPSLKHFWTTFDSRPEETLVVFSNPRFIGSASAGGLEYAPDGATIAPKEINDRYTGIGEAMALQHLTRLFEHLRIPLRAKRSGLIDWDEARTRSFIFVGAPEVNRPQMELPKLEHFAFKASDDPPHAGLGGIINLHPKAGEQPLYLNSGPPYTHDYALIALVSGLAQGRRALILAGRTTYGTQGAVEFLLNEKSTAELLTMLNSKGRPLPYFEALLRVKISGGVPVQPELVLVHKRD